MSSVATLALQQAATAQQAGDMAQATRLLEALLQRQPKNLAALNRLGVLSLQTGRITRGIELLEQALRLQPAQAQVWANLGNGYVLANEQQRALDCYDRALALEPGFAGVLSNRGNALQRLGRVEEAAATFEQLQALDPLFSFASGTLFHCRRQACDWRDFEMLMDVILTGLAAQRLIDRPFSFLSVVDSPEQQLRCAQRYAAQLHPNPTMAPFPVPHRPRERLRIAYVSADFRDHVVAHLIAPLLERHNRADFEIVGVALAPGDGSLVAQRCRDATDLWVDAAVLTDAQAAEHLQRLQIDIAVDLMGYTQGCRPGLFARRVAPVQVNYLGFPGTCGASWWDYIIADEFVLPLDKEHHYAERPVRLPHSFQVNDARRLQSHNGPVTRAACGLPEEAAVLCVFSNSYKLNPAQFALWSRVLRAAPRAVLWLLADNPAISSNLRAQAVREGVAPERLIFAPRVPYAQHLARLALADLLLDTLPFNAGATASDALWLGVPVLTCPGQAFAARMAGSLLRAAGLPELIAATPAEYEALAIALASDPNALQALKAKLVAQRATQPLFDGARYCRHLEQAYRLMARHPPIDAPPNLLGPP